MKRFIGVLLIAIVLAPTVFALGENDSGGSADGVTEVTLWASVGHSRDFEIAKIDEWNEGPGKKAGIRIVPEFFGGDYDNVLALARDSGKLPDIFGSSNMMPGLIEAGMVQPINGTKAGNALVAKYKDYLVENMHTVDGNTYNIPSVANTFRIIVNMDLLKASGFNSIPKTWDEIRMMAKKITKDSNNKKFGLAFPLKWGSNGEHFWKLDAIYGLANEYGFENWYNRDTGRYDFTALAPVLEFMRKAKADRGFLPGAEGLDNDTARAEFSSGNIAFMFAASWDYGVYTNQFPIGDKFEWKVIEFPGSKKFKTPLSAGFRLADGISANSKVDKDILIKVFTDFLYNDEILAEAFALGLYLPVLPSVSSKAKGSLAPQWIGFAPTRNDTPETSIPDGKISINGKTWAEVFMTIWSNDNANIRSALTDLDKRYNKGLDQAIKEGLVDMSKYKN